MAKTIAVINHKGGVGKSTTSVGIATVLAGAHDKKVLLMDADLRLSVMKSVYDISLSGAGMGLAHFLSGQCSLDDAVYETNIPNFYLIPIGTDVQAPLSLIATPDFDTLMSALGGSFDLVIIDAPPIGLVIDAAEIARSCDGSVLVLEYNKTHRRALQEARQQMERTGTPILGCVLNKVAMDRLSTKKYYSYGGRYGYGKYGHYGKYGRNGGQGYYRREDGKKQKGEKK